MLEIFVEIALGSNVGVVVSVRVVVVPDPVDVPVEVDAVVAVAFFEPPWAEPPVVFAVAPAAFAAPPLFVLVVDGPCAAWALPLGACAPTLGAFVVGAFPAPRPCAAAVVPKP